MGKAEHTKKPVLVYYSFYTVKTKQRCFKVCFMLARFEEIPLNNCDFVFNS